MHTAAATYMIKMPFHKEHGIPEHCLPGQTAIPAFVITSADKQMGFFFSLFSSLNF